jgi:opine dehydrogenase
MEVAVLGGGHGCYAAAAELAENGHAVRFWRRDTDDFGPVLETKTIHIKDFRGQRDIVIPRPTTDLGEAIAGAEVIVIPLPATTQEALAENCAPYWQTGQVVFLPPGTFGSYIYLKAARDAGNQADVTFCETGTLPYLARKHGPAYVVISGYGKHLPTGCLPARNSEKALAKLALVYPAIRPIEDGLSGALMNAGGIIHPPLIIMNAGPLEHFERWDIHNEGTQPSIRRTTDALDAERMRLREQLGYGPPHYPLADHYAKEGPEWMYGRGAHEKLTDSGDWREHIVLTEHRYMLEDARLGLSLLSSVGKWAGMEMPLTAGFLAIASAITGRNLYAEGRTLENLGIADLSRAEMRQMLQEGI